MDKESIDSCRQEMKQKVATSRSVHHLKRSSPVANQVMIDVLVMSGGDRNALAAKRKSSQQLPVNDRNLEAGMVLGI